MLYFPVASVVRDSANNYALMKNNQASACPWQAPFLVPAKLGGAQMQRLTCSTNCPFATIEHHPIKPQENGSQMEDIFNYVIECGGTRVIHYIGNKLPDENKKTSLMSV